MLQINDKIVSLDLINEYFSCNLNVCKGACCIEGDAGAPLADSELDIISEVYQIIKKYLPDKNIKTIEQKGKYIIDEDGDYVTPCVNGNECVYLIRNNLCAFEIAYLNSEIDFIKPISCHLYPVRLTKYENFTAVNYQERNICKSGKILGKKKNIKLFEYLKIPLIRAFGKAWFEKLDFAASKFKKLNNV